MASPSLLPPAPRWVQLVCGLLFGALVVELLARNLGAPVDALAWWPLGFGFGPWQLVTRLFVQGGDPRAVVGTVFGLLICWFALGQLDRGMAWRLALAGAVGGTVTALGLDALGVLAPAPTFGWTGLLAGLLVGWGLQRPDAQILVYFLFPLPGRALVWGTLAVAVLVFLSQRTLGTAEALGVWLGVYGWFHTLGPGGRRRRLVQKGRKIEKEIAGFRVIEGGRSSNRGDPWVH